MAIVRSAMSLPINNHVRERDHVYISPHPHPQQLMLNETPSQSSGTHQAEAAVVQRWMVFSYHPSEIDV